MNDIALVEITDIWGSKHRVFKRDLERKRKLFLACRDGYGLCNDATIHRENILKSDTVGFQVVNGDNDCWEHEPFEIIEDFEDARRMLVEAISKEPSGEWNTIQIAKGEIENPSFI